MKLCYLSDNDLPKGFRLSNKNPKCHSWGSFQTTDDGRPKTLPKQYRQLLLLLVIPRNSKVRSIAYFRHKA